MKRKVKGRENQKGKERVEERNERKEKDHCLVYLYRDEIIIRLCLKGKKGNIITVYAQ